MKIEDPLDYSRDFSYNWNNEDKCIVVIYEFPKIPKKEFSLFFQQFDWKHRIATTQNELRIYMSKEEKKVLYNTFYEYFFFEFSFGVWINLIKNLKKYLANRSFETDNEILNSIIEHNREQKHFNYSENFLKRRELFLQELFFYSKKRIEAK